MHKVLSFLFPEHSYSQNKRLPCDIWLQVSSRDGIPPRWHLKLCRAWFWTVVVVSVWGTMGISWAEAEAASTARPSPIPQKVGLPHMLAVPLSRNIILSPSPIPFCPWAVVHLVPFQFLRAAQPPSQKCPQLFVHTQERASSCFCRTCFCFMLGVFGAMGLILCPCS